MSKIWYLATVIPIRKEEELAIKRHIATFIWGKENKNPIKREHIFQPKNKGGLNVKCPVTQQHSLQLKFVKIITDEKTKAPWVQIARYWLGPDLAKIKEEWRFLETNEYPKYQVAHNKLTKGELDQTTKNIS